MTDLATFNLTQFKGDIVTPDDADYLQAIARWAANAKRRAKVVAFVKDGEDVALAIKYARSNALPIAIRGGGHSSAGGSSSEGGLVIDLSRHLDGARVDPDKKLAYVGGGALWKTVDEETAKYGLATVAGTVNHTGVGGLTLGGGFGWLTSEHGMAIDNLVQATIVTADGFILTASEAENPDLFFGIRGGGSNFGVVTEFVFKLHPQRATVYHGIVIFPATALEKFLEVSAKWWENVGEKEAMFQFLSVGPDGKPAISILLFYNGTEAEGRANFKAFLDIGPVADYSKEVPYETVNGTLSEVLAHGQGVYLKGGAFRKPEYHSIAQAFDKIIGFSSPEVRVQLAFEYFPLGKVLSVPQGATALRRDPTPNFVVMVLWKGDFEGSTERGREIAHEITRIILNEQKLTGAESFGYGNYDPEAVAGDKAKAAFAENYPRLQTIKKRYDPENIFNKWFAITPA
ncbi:hypothetical protein H0H81_011882 [Sphagnurus paluster]|uniref:FAD-binding PCMH-type domain-containing protein n=1 Tax=Sphagnurus paluster TaxID=117069 RepID=A0A9P7GIV7_9AGAR|nr:hypothetical protein H0H81_011882 [Sphagnurus paluster]